ncbi:hypothetical protein Ahy_A05g023240 isoform G [Arachis hypogaea]|uniref:Uncharacterized protein n=1 Tax=Arachis hypogaea TaxID=3818 RepID=A0A445D2S0_ARAHY|nr:hypothetical protein Ahy_A05g023240 isoform G [Arachis hypogaea]
MLEKLGMDMKSQYQVIGKTGSEAMLRRGKAIKALQNCTEFSVFLSLKSSATTVKFLPLFTTEALATTASCINRLHFKGSNHQSERCAECEPQVTW